MIYNVHERVIALTDSVLRALKNAYAVLKYATPLENTDCGTICGAACCSGSENDCMFLLPGEDELVKRNGFTVRETQGNSGYPAVLCNGKCNRNARPLACRFFPLFPAVTEENGRIRVKAIVDPRASVSPLTLENVEIPRSFKRAVRKAGLYLTRDSEICAYLKKMTAELLEISELRSRLCGQQK